MTIIYDAEIQVYDIVYNQWIHGNIRQTFPGYYFRYTIQYANRHLIMEQKAFSLMTTIRDEQQQSNYILTQMRLRLSSILWSNKYDLQVYTNELPDALYLLTLTAHDYNDVLKRTFESKQELRKNHFLRVIFYRFILQKIKFSSIYNPLSDPRDIDISNKEWKRKIQCRCLLQKYRSFPSYRLRIYIQTDILLTNFAFAMQQFQTYSLSNLRKNDRYPVVDDTNNPPYFSDNLSRITSNDSGISYDDSDDNESLFSNDNDFDFPDINSSSTITITDDAQLAAVICDDDKKYFCQNTAWAWHGEFGRLIMATAMTYHIDYRLMLYDAGFLCPRAMNASYTMTQSDNAKGQFKCDICGHCWTSMRARCSFYISKPNEGGIVLLRLYTQQCQYCYSTVHPLWYFDEICRVMKNLALTMFKHFFPNSISSIYWDMTHNGIQAVRRLYQRKGNMNAQHNSSLCEACQLGLCYF